MIEFDYPLNEKARNYLRFEYLFSEIQCSLSLASPTEAMHYFKCLFDLIELAERTDVKQDLGKDLRSQLKQLSSWLAYEQVDKVAINELVDEVKGLIEELNTMPKLSRYYKNNRFLTSLKQRFCIAGGTCNFDIPQYHLWLANDIEIRQKESKNWFEQFSSLQKGLVFLFNLKRLQSTEINRLAENAFYQGEAENGSFITIKIAKNLSVYPMISGHKNRYSVRFIGTDLENRLSDNIEFTEISY